MLLTNLMRSRSSNIVKLHLTMLPGDAGAGGGGGGAERAGIAGGALQAMPLLGLLFVAGAPGAAAAARRVGWLRRTRLITGCQARVVSSVGGA
jgi:hypothetical protein